MGTHVTLALQIAVAAKIRQVLPGAEPIPRSRAMWRRGSAKFNVRTRATGSAGKFWFDVTPHFYERGEADHFVFACGDANHVYVLPGHVVQEAAGKASLGGEKQVPQLDFYLGSHELAPAGSGQRLDVRKYFNAFSLISGAAP